MNRNLILTRVAISRSGRANYSNEFRLPEPLTVVNIRYSQMLITFPSFVSLPITLLIRCNSFSGKPQMSSNKIQRIEYLLEFPLPKIFIPSRLSTKPVFVSGKQEQGRY